MTSPLERATPDWSSHPVDVLKWCAEQMGREIEPESEAKLRAICDEPVEVDPIVLGDADWRIIPTPAPTRIVEYDGTPTRAPVRVKGVKE